MKLKTRGRCLSASNLLNFVLAIALFTSMAATYAEGEEGVIEEILVTATKRSESIQDVPASITAFSASRIELLEIQNVRDLQFSVPGLVASHQNGANLTRIRGIGQNSASGIDDPAVAQHIDGVYQPATHSVLLALSDLERVEVLKGPQGTLYGRNATGGTINYITKKPTKEFEAGIDVVVGNYSRKGFKGFVSGSLSDTFSARLSLISNDRDGYVDVIGPFSGGYRADDTFGGRLALRFEPNDSVTIDLSASSIETESLIAYQLVGIVDPLTAFYFFPGNHTDEPNKVFTNVADQDGYTNQDSYVGTVSWDVNDRVTIKSITAYLENEHVQSNFDTDGSDFPFFSVTGNYDISSETFTQELSISYIDEKTSLVAGAFLLDDEAVFDSSFPLFFLFTTFDQEARAWAVFADLTYSVTDRLRLIAGARHNKEKKEINQTNTFFCPMGLQRDEEWDDFTPKFGFQFDIGDNAMAYGTWQDGHKAGGFDANSCADVFDPESVEAIEVGLKTTFAEGRGTFNAAIFDYDYQDMQVQQIDATGLQTEINNAASASVTGVELDVSWLLTDSFLVEANGSYADTEFGDFFVDDPFVPGIDLVNRSGDPLSRTPEFSGALAGQYTGTFDDGSILTIRAELYYSDDVPFTDFGIASMTGFGNQDSYTTGNLYIAYEPSFLEYLKIRLFGKNLSDEDILTGTFNSSAIGIINGNYAIGRTYGAEVSLRF